MSSAVEGRSHVFMFGMFLTPMFLFKVGVGGGEVEEDDWQGKGERGKGRGKKGGGAKCVEEEQDTVRCRRYGFH